MGAVQRNERASMVLLWSRHRQIVGRIRLDLKAGVDLKPASI